MTPPPGGPPRRPDAAARDQTTLWGVLGIVFALCCPPIGLLFGILSLLEAKRFRRVPILAYLSFVLFVAGGVINVILVVQGRYDVSFAP